MANPVVYSEDGRIARQVTSKEELEAHKEQGYSTSKPKVTATANSGAEGHRRARAASTTGGHAPEAQGNPDAERTEADKAAEK